MESIDNYIDASDFETPVSKPYNPYKKFINRLLHECKHKGQAYQIKLEPLLREEHLKSKVVKQWLDTFSVSTAIDQEAFAKALANAGLYCIKIKYHGLYGTTIVVGKADPESVFIDTPDGLTFKSNGQGPELLKLAAECNRCLLRRNRRRKPKPTPPATWSNAMHNNKQGTALCTGQSCFLCNAGHKPTY